MAERAIIIFSVALTVIIAAAGLLIVVFVWQRMREWERRFEARQKRVQAEIDRGAREGRGE